MRKTETTLGGREDESLPEDALEDMAEKMDLFSQAVILFVRIRLTTLGGKILVDVCSQKKDQYLIVG